MQLQARTLLAANPCSHMADEVFEDQAIRRRANIHRASVVDAIHRVTSASRLLAVRQHLRRSKEACGLPSIAVGAEEFNVLCRI